jgi:hypothetical protein
VIDVDDRVQQILDLALAIPGHRLFRVGLYQDRPADPGSSSPRLPAALANLMTRLLA